MKKQILASVAFAALTMFSAFGADSDGNIRSIDAMPQSAKKIVFPNSTAPITSAGQEIYILVRLLNYNWEEEVLVGSSPKPWYFRSSASATSATLASVNLPALGISVGGIARRAVYTAQGPNGEESGANKSKPWYTDLYFVYTTQAGDIGLPVKLLDKNVQVPTAFVSTDYLLYNANTAGSQKYAPWDLTTDATADDGKNPLANFYYGPENPSGEDGTTRPEYPSEPHTTAHRSYDLAAEGIYIRTLDFDTDYADAGATPDKIWREVQQGTDEPYSVEATIEGAVTGAVVYVWSENDNIVQPTARGDAVYYDDGTSRKVLAVTIRDGKGTFGLKGTGDVNATTKIYMSSATSAGYSLVGDKIEASACSRTVKVREAPAPHITVSNYGDETKFAVVATTNYEAATVMKVAVSERFDENPITFKLSAKFMRGATDVETTELDPVAGNYIRILTEDNDPTITTGTDEVTIPAGAKEATFYLYGLGSPSDRTVNKLVISAEITDPTTWARYSGGNNRFSTITLSNQAPVILIPAESAIFTGFDGDEIQDFNVTIADNWRDLQQTENTEGYTVTVTFPNGGSSSTQTGVHFTDGVPSSIKVTAPAEGTYPAIITVRDPSGNTGTREVTIKAAAALDAKIKAYKDATLQEPYPDGYVFHEGETPYVRVELSSPASAPMYAFLRPENAAAKTLVSCSAVDKGLAIAQSDTASAAVQIQFLDGYKALDPMRATFTVGLLATEDWNDTPDIDYTKTYAPRTREFTVVNVSPSIRAGTMRMSATYVANGEMLTAKAPAGSPVTFTANLEDPSTIDLTAEGDEAIWARWVYTDGVEGSKSDYVLFSEAAKRRISCPITFNEEGQTQTVKVYLLDKDDRAEQDTAGTMQREDFEWGEPAYTFSVNVSQTATVKIMDVAGEQVETLYYTESVNKRDGYFYLQLSTAPGDAGTYTDPDTGTADDRISAANPIVVELTLEEWGSDGKVELETTEVELSDGNRKKVYFNALTLNGGVDTCYNITAKVKETDLRNSYGQKWSDFYQPSASEIIVYNDEPLISSVKRVDGGGSLVEVGTNTWSAGATIRLDWQVRDIIPDITSGNFTITWSVDSADPTQYPNPLVLPTTQTYTISSTKFANVKGTYEFQVPDVQNQILRLEIDDGDGGHASKEWIVYVAQTKKLAVSPTGPMEPSETKYRRASGLGRGSVYVDDSTGIAAVQVRDFVQTWAFDETRAQAGVTAEGYPATDTDAFDDGTRGAAEGYTGVPISPEGRRGTAGNYYNYGNSAYDNFFYCWATIGGENGIEILMPVPSARSKTHLFALDTEKKDNASYKTMQVEAIFSREFLPSDNMGDINADAVPDAYAFQYEGLGVFTEDANGGVSMTGNDLTNIGGQNVDADYFPNTMSAAYSSFIPGSTNSWVMQGRAFTTRQEIRGVDDHFNNGPAQSGITSFTSDIRYTDPAADADSTLSALEYRAFVEWCGRQDPALDATDEANWSRWSPERPTDPTNADTDSDGIPDGCEYYYWYKAHVGYFKTTTDDEGNETVTYERMTGRKYNPLCPAEPFTITSDTIEQTFDPLVANPNASTMDSDNDGLTDLIELELGTNPFDYDTDGDGLPDGWEVLFEMDPLVYDSSANSDGDQMAVVSLTMYPVTITYGDDGATTETYYATEEDAAVLESLAQPSDLTKESEVKLFKTWTYKSGTTALGAVVYDVANEDQLGFLTGCTSITVDSATEVDVNAYHYQVYALNGFDPRVAWNTSEAPIYHRIDTAAFSAYDEFMLLAFFRQVGGVTETDIANRKMQEVWKDYTTDPANADTDADGVPDGWEMYVMGGGAFGGRSPATASISPLSTSWPTSPSANDASNDLDVDGLTGVKEWCGVENCLRYEGCETITNLTPEWKNKIWPTDPWANDTDGDGVLDGDEFTWIYGSNEHKTPSIYFWEDCVEGGGLNPLSWDTDLDGLPDPWELEFSAELGQIYVASSDGTNSTETVTAYHDGNGMNPTLSDAFLDYDHDGLLNWQEYMVGAMRCWRYDDTTSPWTSHALTSADIAEHATDGDWWGHLLVDYWPSDDGTVSFNPGLQNGHFDLGTYFSCCDLAWDDLTWRKRLGKFYMFKDGIDHDLRDDTEPTEIVTAAGSTQISCNRWTAKLAKEIATWTELPSFEIVTYPSLYITCDPRKADTDGDGMDDYYELFHGLNPLLGLAGSASKDGPCDVVYRAWYETEKVNGTIPPSALANYYVDGETIHNGSFAAGPDGVRVKHADVDANNHSVMDFYNFPWLAGLPDADPDGDNIRNQQEAILPNVQAAATYQHTDPTPLWMTDTSFENSLTHRFYQGDTPAWAERTTQFIHPTGRFIYKGKTYRFDDFPWMSYDPLTMVVTVNYGGVNLWDANGALFSYEENEGYDSDHDYLSDYEESQGKTKASSDPQQHDDPIRHQAMWFNGTDAFLQTPLAEDYLAPSVAANAETRQNFLYFTVEAWVKPDADIVGAEGLYTVVERAIVTGESSAADENFLRKNFLVGLKNGRWYARFDSAGTDAKQPVEITNGPEATTNWTHVAVSYGPVDDDETSSASQMALKLYVNGTLARTMRTAIQPEHGLSAITINSVGAISTNIVEWARFNNKPLISILVGASADTARGVVLEFGWETRNQWADGTYPFVSEDDQTSLDDYDAFFKGYVDEVRIWDGARTAADIQNDVKNKVRYTSALAQENRTKVFNAWKKGARRSPASTGVLPAELMYHWSFDHLPGATRAEDVLQAPAGFLTSGTITDAKAMWSRPENWVCERWNALALRSSVYKDASWVPWINNTVSHLPNIDLTTLDSVYWSEDYAGTNAASSAGYKAFAFPRTAEVYSAIVQSTRSAEPYSTPTRWLLAGTNEDAIALYRFNLRNRTTTGKDLLPLGGAFPKRISLNEGGLWDDGCAADAWAETGLDADNNGLPDDWERYARSNYTTIDPWESFGWDTTVNYRGTGVLMPAWQAYLRDLAYGWLPDGEYHAEYVDTRDEDCDGIPDWWESLYGIDTKSADDALADSDGDGLSNRAEYLISEVFNFAWCDPTLYATMDGVCDYFRKVGDLYLGEIFTDHDQMDDKWEAAYDASYVNRHVYDPLGDADGDGWSNYAEFRAQTDPTATTAMSIDGYRTVEYPVPTIAANVIYHGASALKGALVFKAWNEDLDFDMVKTPDAVWTLGSSDTSSDDTSTASSSTSESIAEELVSHEKFIGRKPTSERTFYLSGGHVGEGSVKLLFLDKGFAVATSDETTGEVTLTGAGKPDEALWYYNIYDNDGKLLRVGSSATDDEDDVVVGSIDYKSGRVTIDFACEALSGKKLADPSSAESSSSSSSSSSSTSTYHYLNFDNAYVRVTWKSSSVSTASVGLHYLSDADTTGDVAHHLREGKNTFICFVDEDGDGEYTAGELFGIVRGVDVGWSGATLDVELTETHPIFGRFDLTGGNDRAYWFGADSGNVSIIDGTYSSPTNGTTASPSGGMKQHVRVARYAVNGVKIGIGTNDIFVSSLILLDKWFTYGSRFYINEGDFIGNGSFDIDWDTLVDLESEPAFKRKFPDGDITSVSYRIVVDNMTAVNPTVSNRVLDVAFTRAFDSKSLRKVATDLNAVIAYGAHPTFTWTMNGYDTYTAFKLRVLDEGNNVVYESDMTRAPAVDAKGYYTWKAPFSIGDQTPQGKIFEKIGNYKWSVSMYNAKFREDKWSESALLTANVTPHKVTDRDVYGAIDAVIKYAGPELVLKNCETLSSTEGIVRVQAFESPDFTGCPAAQTFVADKASLINPSNETANVTLCGLPVGTYYLRAYIDSDGDFEKDDWESFGISSGAVTLEVGKTPETAVIWIEDADTDGDGLPDAWEYARFGNLDAASATVDPDGEIVLKETTYAVLANGEAWVGEQLSGTTLTFFRNLDAATLLLGLGSTQTASALTAVRAAVQREVEPDTLCISSLTIDNSDAANPQVVMTVSAEVADSAAARLLSAVYTLPMTTEVTLSVYKKASLVDANWVWVKDVKVAVSTEIDETIRVDLDEDLSSGFYKVVVTK